ncbi:MAG: serine protease [Acidimicrobiia bacterium]
MSIARNPVRFVGRDRVATVRVAALIMAVFLAGCGEVEPAGRSVVVQYSGCGDGFGGAASGVLVGPERVVTVAHAVAQADAVFVGWNAVDHEAHVIGYDPRTDLALLDVPGLIADPVAFAEAQISSPVAIVGGLVSGDVNATVAAVVKIRIEEVLGTRKVSRHGLELRAPAVVGDSGAGVYDERGRLVGVIFAVNDDGSAVAWATAAREVQALLERNPENWECDPQRSRLVANQD